MQEIFPSSLNLDLEEHTHRRNDPAEIAQALAPRAEVGSLKIAQLRMLSSDGLEEEAGMLRQMHRVVRDAVDNGGAADKEPSGNFLRRLEYALVSKDQGWRVILECLNRQDSSYEDHKRAGLIAYQTYLQARLDMIETLLGSAAKRTPPKESGRHQKASNDDLLETSEFLLKGGNRKSSPNARIDG